MRRRKGEGRGGYREGAGRPVSPHNNGQTLVGKIQREQLRIHDGGRALRLYARRMAAAAADTGIDGAGLKIYDYSNAVDDAKQKMLEISDARQCLRLLYALREKQIIDECAVMWSDEWAKYGIHF